MRRYLESSTPTPSGRYGLALTELTEPTELTEAPLTPEQCWALASYQRPTVPPDATAGGRFQGWRVP